MREAGEHARNKNEWRMIVAQFWLASVIATGLPYRGNPVVGAVGEMASMKRRKLWKTGEDGLCCSSSAIQARPGPSSLLEEWSVTPIVFVVFFVLSDTPQTVGNGQGIYIGRQLYGHNFGNNKDRDLISGIPTSLMELFLWTKMYQGHYFVTLTLSSNIHRSFFTCAARDTLFHKHNLFTFIAIIDMRINLLIFIAVLSLVEPSSTVAY